MLLRTKFDSVNYKVALPRVSEISYKATKSQIEADLERSRVKNRDVIADAFLYILRRSPGANASDLWHHVVYRLYCELIGARQGKDPRNSWVRASGEALEIIVQQLYSPVFEPHGITIRALISGSEKRRALAEMGLASTVGGSKLDVGLYFELETHGQGIFGGVHVKASLAERVSDDVPASRTMMERGYFSPLWTLDVKSFPPPHGDLVNRVELGRPENPSDKRRYIEHHGDFDNCYSGNSRTVPSRGVTPSGKRIYALDLLRQPDKFARDVIARAKSGVPGNKAH